MITDMLIELAFPLAALAAGGFLIFRGVKRLQGAIPVISGNARCQNVINSPLTGKRSVYSKLVLECYSGGHSPWQQISEVENRVPFYVGDRLVTPEFADFRITPVVYQGLVKRNLGVLDQFKESIVGARPISLARDVISSSPIGGKGPADEEYLPENIVTVIKAVENLKKSFNANIKKPLRVSEYSIAEGAQVSVAGGKPGNGKLEGTLESRLLITDSGEDTARASERERTFFGILAGGVLLMLSLLLFVFVIFSV